MDAPPAAGAAPALIAAAIDAYDEQLNNEIVAFRDAANHGRPEIHPESGKLVKLRMLGQRYDVLVERTAPASYRLASAGHIIEAEVEQLGKTGNRLRCAGREHRIVSVVHGATHFVEVDGVGQAAGRIASDDADQVNVRPGRSAGSEASRIEPFVE